MSLETFPFDAARYLNTPEAIAWFIRETLESDDQEEIADSLDIVERAMRMHGIVGRDGISPDERSTAPLAENTLALLKVLHSLGYSLTIEAVAPEQPAEAA